MVLWFSPKHKKIGAAGSAPECLSPGDAHAPGVVRGTYSPFHQLGGHHGGVSFGS